MQQLMENWRSYLTAPDRVKLLLEEKGSLEQFKDSPKHVEDLLKQVAQVKDQKQLANIAQALLKDPEIKAAADVIVSASDEIKKQEQPVEEIQQVKDFVQDASSKVYTGAQDILSHPKVQAILRHGAPVVMMGALLATLLNPEMGMQLSTLAGTMADCKTGDAAACMASVVGAVGDSAAGVEYSPQTAATEEE